MGIPFYKMSGSGNDFIVIDNRKSVLDGEFSDKARLLCRDRFSVGANGVILLYDSPGADFGWRLFNSDGSEAEMCGNGARCVALFSYLVGITGEKMSFATMAGRLSGWITGDDRVKVELTKPTGMKQDITVGLGDGFDKVDFVNSGVPHAVYVVDDIDTVDMNHIGKQTRWHQAFSPQGTNVNAMQVLSPDRARVRTYERGVEEETKACGTGAVASVLVGMKRGLLSQSVTVVPTGTIELVVSRSDSGSVFLEGDAHVVCKGEIEPGAFA